MSYGAKRWATATSRATLLDGRKTQHTIRIAGIDAPEKGQPYGTASREHLASLIFKRQTEARCYKRDRYGREICRVFNDGGQRDIGLEQIRAGLAWWFREYANEQTAEEQRAYESVEDAARAAKRGLWKEPRQTAPWEWRRGKREPTVALPSVGTSPAAPKSAPGVAAPLPDPVLGCSCGSGNYCVGPRGGIYCVTSGGNKSYVPQ